MAVFLMSEGWTGIWWYPFFKSRLLKMVAPARLLVMSARFGRGEQSASEIKFRQ